MKHKFMQFVSVIFVINLACQGLPLAVACLRAGYDRYMRLGTLWGKYPDINKGYLRPLAAGEARPAAEHEKWLLEKRPQGQGHSVLRPLGYKERQGDINRLQLGIAAIRSGAHGEWPAI